MVCLTIDDSEEYESQDAKTKNHHRGCENLGRGTWVQSDQFR